MELDVRRLRALREVALCGTVAAAADAMGFTPSAISQQLSALERESNTVLLEKTGRRLRLTDAGRLLVERTEPVLTALEEAAGALESTHHSITGEVKVASFSSGASALVVPVAVEVTRQHPALPLLV